ncbi:hypothetical protein CJU89_5754 [Yarrowia sp. B02]|nr:hypothetical protein CJU89_5754 [Yarrowia sp. B02]
MADSEKSAAQLAREKRQARIKQKAAERMAKITGTVRPAGFDDADTNTNTKTAADEAKAFADEATAAASAYSADSVKTDSVKTDSVKTAKSASTTAPTTVSSEDPPDVDISVPSRDLSHDHSRDHHLPSIRNREDPFGSIAASQDDPFAQMLQQMLGQGMEGTGQGMGQGEEPDLSKLMSMMMGEGGEGQGNPFAGLAGAGGAGLGQQGMGSPQQPVPSARKNLVWTILHTLTAVLIGIYTVATFGHKWNFLEAYFEPLHHVKPLILFISVQLVLQTARLVQDKGRLPPDSMLLQIASFVPQPYRGYIESGSRLYKTFNLAKSDFFVVLFVYGLSTVF